jgi:hypothetical protein
VVPVTEMSDEEIRAVLGLQWLIFAPPSPGDRWYAAPRNPGDAGGAAAPSVEELAIKLRYATSGPAWWRDYGLAGGCDDLAVAAELTGQPESTRVEPAGTGPAVSVVVSRSGWCYLRPRADGVWGLCAPSLRELGDRAGQITAGTDDPGERDGGHA